MPTVSKISFAAALSRAASMAQALPSGFSAPMAARAAAKSPSLSCLSFVRRLRAVPEPWASRQPHCPQGQRAGWSYSTFRWPNSPAKPSAPRSSLPSATTAPPTPVLTVIQTKSE